MADKKNQAEEYSTLTRINFLILKTNLSHLHN